MFADHPPMSRLLAIHHRRWSGSILAELARERGCKFVTLTHRLGASPGAVRDALDDLIARGWVIPNPGYGHPLRPEYILTPEGEELAPACARLVRVAGELRVRPVILRRWPMPVLRTLAEGPARFTQMGDALGAITDRALSHALRDLKERALLSPARGAGWYAPSASGRRLIPALVAIG
jgi:DNA-binding HxlR family transcriptional regulator